MKRCLPRILFIWFKNIEFNCVYLFDLEKHFCNFIDHRISKQSDSSLESESYPKYSIKYILLIIGPGILTKILRLI